VTSARYDHEELSSHETAAPHPALVDRTNRRNIPLFGLGIGNDFGRGNETYLNVSQGYRPLRYLDIASPFSNFASLNNPDPTKYVTYELGVHGWPVAGFYYDVSLFQVNVHDRIESRQLSQTETIDVNTGNTRSRGAELEGAYDVLRLWASVSAELHLDVFANASLLNARFTGSKLPNQTGKTPAYAPNYVLKAGATLRKDAHYKLSLIVDSVDSQFFQDSNAPIGSTPARIPSYTVADVSGEYTLIGGLRLLGGISNLTDRRYYSRVFISRGQLEPARTRTFYAGLACDF
jgi:Fe(3+) dicitrate transport protein